MSGLSKHWPVSSGHDGPVHRARLAVLRLFDTLNNREYLTECVALHLGTLFVVAGLADQSARLRDVRRMLLVSRRIARSRSEIELKEAFKFFGERAKAAYRACQTNQEHLPRVPEVAA